jgi:acetyl-CoA C-acetyltransferase
MSLAKAKELGVVPLARIVYYAVAGVHPDIMGYGPVPATRKALAKAGLTLKDIDLIEVNEAFAAQYLTVERELKLNRETTNVNGSGIALGHPVGCTGVRLIVTLLYEMKRRKDRLGLATLCSGGGMGMAIIIENIT